MVTLHAPAEANAVQSSPPVTSHPVNSHPVNSHRVSIEQSLAVVVGDVSVLAMKVQGYHWNVEGSAFWSLHKQFEEIYHVLQGFVDPLAERLRFFSRYAPGSMQEMLGLSGLKEELGPLHVPNAKQMQQRLLNDITIVLANVARALDDSKAAGDDATQDMLTQVDMALGKIGWMLRSALRDD